MLLSSPFTCFFQIFQYDWAENNISLYHFFCHSCCWFDSDVTAKSAFCWLLFVVLTKQNTLFALHSQFISSFIAFHISPYSAGGTFRLSFFRWILLESPFLSNKLWWAEKLILQHRIMSSFINSIFFDYSPSFLHFIWATLTWYQIKRWMLAFCLLLLPLRYS